MVDLESESCDGGDYRRALRERESERMLRREVSRSCVRRVRREVCVNSVRGHLCCKAFRPAAFSRLDYIVSYYGDFSRLKRTEPIERCISGPGGCQLDLNTTTMRRWCFVSRVATARVAPTPKRNIREPAFGISRRHTICCFQWFRGVETGNLHLEVLVETSSRQAVPSGVWTALSEGSYTASCVGATCDVFSCAGTCLDFTLRSVVLECTVGSISPVVRRREAGLALRGGQWVGKRRSLVVRKKRDTELDHREVERLQHRAR
ncbi:hypothetical protein GOBAR_DD16415 [Gossypium barbadense]|nr:hypothetical protein GOBAR_DD16415 [Gossypium barbadense]